MIRREDGAIYKVMDKRIDCLLTLDYELFFKKSGDARTSVLDPTQRLMDVLDKIGGKATFFIDTIYLNLLRDSDREDNRILSGEFESQLQRLVEKGHRIELHLHPHWLDAYQEADQWFFPTYEHYKLQSLPKERIMGLFREGSALLNQIARRSDPDYQVNAFRAGGWCVEPFEMMKEAFVECGIKIDSSVVPLMKLDGKIHELDYSDIPPQAYYRFSDDIRVADKFGQFIEFPVNGYYLNLWEKLRIILERRKKKDKAKVFGNGEGINILAHRSDISKLYALFSGSKQYNQFGLDGYVNAEIMANKLSSIDLPFVSMVAHPKSLTISSLQCIEHLAAKGYKFVTFMDVCKKYKL